MKKYEWTRLGGFTFTWSTPPEPERVRIDLNDPTLENELIEINPGADPFTQPEQE